MPSHDRPLYLHISALSPEEFDSYTNVLTELAGPGQDDDVWDRPVDVMEARGWIRGRYGLDATMVDKVRSHPFPRPCSSVLVHKFLTLIWLCSQCLGLLNLSSRF